VEQRRIYGALKRHARKDNIPDFLVWNEIAMLPSILHLEDLKEYSPKCYYLANRYLELEKKLNRLVKAKICVL
jgi:hypothetical protein